MKRHILILFVCTCLLQSAFGVYTREELSTKPPYTKKVWRKIAIQPSDLNTQNIENSHVTIHHNYSRVQVHGSNPDDAQTITQHNPVQTVVITETKQTKTYTYPPEVGQTAEQFEAEVEPIWTKPQRYEGLNIEQHRTPKGHYIVREQSGTNLEQSSTESSEVKVSDKLMRLEQNIQIDDKLQKFETFEEQVATNTGPYQAPENNFGTSFHRTSQQHTFHSRPNEQQGNNFGTSFQQVRPDYTHHSRPNVPQGNNFGSSHATSNLEQVGTSYQHTTNQEQTRPEYTLHSRPNVPQGNNFGSSHTTSNQEQVGTSYQHSTTNQEQIRPEYTYHSRPNVPQGNNFSSSHTTSNHEQVGTSFQQSTTNQEQNRQGHTFHSRPNIPHGNNFGSSHTTSNQEQVGTSYQHSTANQEQVRPEYTLHSRPNVSPGNNFGSSYSTTNQDHVGTISGTNNERPVNNFQYARTTGEQTRTNYQTPGYTLHSRPNEGSQNNFNPQKPTYKVEIRPKTSTYVINTKSYSNMAFENCPKNSTGPVAYLWSCTQFLNCWKGRGIVQNCAPGTKFNPETLECDFPHKVKCISGAHDQKVKSEKYSEQNICAPNFSGLLPHPTDCTKFVNCAFGQSFVQDCGPGTAFNSVIQACDYPHKVGCEIQPGRESENYQLEEVDLRGPINNQLGYGFQPGNTGDYNQDGSTVIRVYDNNLVSQQKQFGNTGQNCGPNCGGGYGYNQQQGRGYQTQAGQNCGHDNCRTGQTTQQESGPNCGSNNDNCQQQSSRAHSVQYPQNFDQHGQYIQSTPSGSQTTNYNGQNSGRYSQTTTTSTGYGQQNTQLAKEELKTEVKCPTGHTGLLPHPYICEKFLNCANGLTYVQDCGPGTVFNPSSKVCDWPYNVKCNTKSNDDKREITNTQFQRNTTSYGQNTGSNYGHNTGQYYGQTTQRNTSRHSQNNGQTTHNTNSGYGQNYGQTTHGSNSGYGQNTGQYYGQNTGQYHGQTTHRNTTIYGQGTHGSNSGYGQNTGQNYGQNTGQYHGQTTHRNTTSYGQATHGSNSGYGQNTGQNYGQNTGQYHGQTTQRNTTIYGQNYGQGTHNTNSGYGQNYGQNTDQYHEQTTQRNTSRHSQNNGQTTHNTNSGYGQNYGQNTGQYHGQATQRNTTIYGQTIHSTGPNYGQNHGLSSGSQYGQNYGQTVTQTNRNSGGSYGQTNTQTTSSTSGQNSGYDQQYSGSQQYNRTAYYQGQNINQNTGYTRVIGYRREPSSHSNQNWSQNNQPGYATKQPGYKPTTSDNIRPIYYRHYSNNHEDKNIQQIIEPATPTVLNYTINVEDNTRKTGRHWPPPFPSTDTSADYYFEEVTEASSNKNGKKVWKNSKSCKEGEFECSFNECIPEIWHCDGEEDCRNGSDEKNCEMHLKKFTIIPNARLYKHEVEKWLNTDLQTCANYCLNSKVFGCRSFNFRKNENVCLLCDTNVGLSGALANSHLYDYYEISAYSVNCSDMYKCTNGKCINYTQICDGNDDCGNRQDEKNCSAESIGYEIKLGGSQFKNEGRIEVKVFNEWGYICDDKFGLRNADVVCKELGFPEGALEVKTGSFFGRDVKENETFYLMDDVQCIGNETSIRNCDFNGWGTHNCMPQEIAGIVCKTPQENCPVDHWKCDTTKECLPIQFVCDGVFDCEDRSDEGVQHCEAPIEVRLVNGTSKFEGRVEIRFHGVWGTICDDDFNDLSARVVCKSLGFHGSAVAKKDGAFGSGIGPIWLDQVNCIGNESLIEDCTHWNWGEHNCEHSEDAGVVCSYLDTSQYEKKSKDGNIANITPIKPSIDETIFKGKCGFRGDDLFTDEENEDSEIHFRVVKGSLARKGDYPWQATIRVKGKHKSTHWCGAVVISNKYVLTAAHCLVGFSKGAYVIRAGDYNVNEEEGTEVESFIEDFFVHEKFRQGGHMNNDIALIKLKGPGLKLSKHVQPICLPEKDAKYKPGLNCTISGFGSTETGKSTSSHQLRAGWVKIQADETCKMPQVYGEAITPGMFCAGSLDEGVDSCDGDSGGPLACLNNGLFTLYGITSWGQRCGHINKPGVYVRVSEYIDWINRIIEETSY